MKNILLIGGNGYVGSFLNYKFKDKYNISNIDLNYFSNYNITDVCDYRSLTKEYINGFDVVILLAGHSSVKMCDTDMVSSFNNNVRNFIDLLTKLNTTQKFIYASSSSVYGDSGKSVVDENYNYFEPNNYYDMTKKIIDMYAIKSNVNYYGLRFGTVNGWSPVLRTDIMINSMVHSVKTDGFVKVYIKDIMRPILGINDLANAIEAIIVTENSQRGIYNLASFNSTADEISVGVAKHLGVPVVEYDVDQVKHIENVKLQTKTYDFSIDSTKFINNFSFKFKETIETITDSLNNNYDNCLKTNRSEILKYE